MVYPAGMLDMLKVDAYGDSLPMKSVGAVSVRDAHTLLVTVFDPTVRAVHHLAQE